MDNGLFLSPAEISKAIRSIGEKKANANLFELFIFGILAGIYILLLALMLPLQCQAEVHWIKV